MTIRMTVDQFSAWLVRQTPELERAGVRGMRKGAVFLHGQVVLEIGRAQPRPAVDTGELRNSVNTTAHPQGAIVSVDAPHAPFMEYGRRPGKMPPVGPIEDWLRRKGFGTDLINQQRRTIARGAIRTVGRSAAIRSLRANKGDLEAAALRGAAFVIARGIAKNGIAPRAFFRKAWAGSQGVIALSLLSELAKIGWKPTSSARGHIAAALRSASAGARSA